MAKKNPSHVTPTFSDRISADFIATLKLQLKTKDEQIAGLHAQLLELSSQLRMAMEDKFYHPEIVPKPDPEANKLHGPDFPADVEEFDAEEDGKLIGSTEDIDSDINRQIDKIAAEQGFSPAKGWAEEHRA